MAETVFGIPAADVLGQQFNRSSIRWEWSAVCEALEKVHLDRASVTIESFPFQAPDNSKRLLDIVVNPVVSNDGIVRATLLNATDVTERELEAKKLSEHVQRYQSLFDYNPDAVYSLDLAGVFQDANIAGQAMAGYTIEEGILNSMSFIPMIAPEDLEKTMYHFMVACQGIPQNYDCSFVQRTGEKRAIHVINTPIIIDGEIVGIYGIAKDITDLKQAQAALVASEQRFRALVANASDVIAIVSPDGDIHYVSPSVSAMWGYEADYLSNKPFWDLDHPADLNHAKGLVAYTQAFTDETCSRELRLLTASGTYTPHEVISSNQQADPAVGGIILTCRDITERKAFEDRLTHYAFYDSLTALPNRVLFQDRLSHALNACAAREESVAVLFVDIDNFKIINDSLGHGPGDELLRIVAARMRTCLRPQDTLARLGGDEFTILMPEVRDRDEAVNVASNIASALRTPIQLQSHEVFVTASVGVAISDKSNDSPSDLLQAADIAMYQAKNSGKARHAVYDRAMTAHAIERLELEADLRAALTSGQLRVYYQPVFDLWSGHIYEVEALVRWEHPTRGLLGPNKFIPIAEETGLILPLGLWVLTEACRQAKQWQIDFPKVPPLVVNVNLSARQFQNPDLVSDVASVLNETGLAPSSLTLEITEGLMMDRAEESIRQLHLLKELGLQLAVDDFGTGYSSMAYLSSFPLDTLKIDRSFVKNLGLQAESEAIVRAIITLAHALNLDVTSEGIESAEQWTSLQKLGSNRGQGFFYSCPVPAEEIAILLASPKVPPLELRTLSTANQHAA